MNQYEPQEEIKTLTLALAKSIFTKEDRFESEKEFVQSLIPILPQIVETFHDDNISSITKERHYKFKEYGGVNLIADISIRTNQGKYILIECKNPTHEKAETFNAIGQMMAYQLNQEIQRQTHKIILATSIFDESICKAMMRFNLNFDLILHNHKTTCYLYNEELSKIVNHG